MLSLIGFVSCMLVLSTAFFVVEPLSLGRLDGGSKILCTRAVLDTDDEGLSPNDSRYRRILIQNDSDSEDEYDEESSPSDRGFQDGDTGAYDEGSEDRSNLEWKKIRRYIKRQLKVPKRYLKKIVRTLSVAATLRSSDGDDTMVSLVPSSDSDELNNILARANGRFDTKRLLVVDDPKSVEYFAVIAAPGNRMYQ